MAASHRWPILIYVQLITEDSAGPLRCAACDVAIGVYEPLVEVMDGFARESSRAKEPGLRAARGSCYHVVCHQSIAAAPSAAARA